MATNERSVELAGVDLAGQNHVARLNHVLSKYNAAVICNYDLSKFSASVAVDTMRTHPLVIIGGLLRENPFFVPPDLFLAEMHERRSAHVTAG